ncbi:DNA-binding protein [Candidatus Woesearchaeota archaeon]|nr:DNA-binding protein [Candidatus Woesearchaeota archaeon]
MAIKDLKPKQGNVTITADIIEKGDVREFQKFGKAGRVCNARIKDATGEISMTLWNDEIDQVEMGDTIRIENGYVNEWQGELQISAGRFGKIIVEKRSDSPAKQTPVAGQGSEESTADDDAGEDVETSDEEEVI